MNDELSELDRLYARMTDLRAELAWKQDQANAYGVWAMGTLVASFVACLCLTGYQVFEWLRTGEWFAMPLASFGLAWLGVEWAANPTTWLGLHRLLDWFSVGAALVIVGLVLSLVIAGTFYDPVASDAAHLKDQLERAEKDRERLIGAKTPSKSTETDPWLS